MRSRFRVDQEYVRKLLKQNLSVSIIAKRVGCNVSTVRTIKDEIDNPLGVPGIDRIKRNEYCREYGKIYRRKTRKRSI